MLREMSKNSNRLNPAKAEPLDRLQTLDLQKSAPASFPRQKRECSAEDHCLAKGWLGSWHGRIPGSKKGFRRHVGVLNNLGFGDFGNMGCGHRALSMTVFQDQGFRDAAEELLTQVIFRGLVAVALKHPEIHASKGVPWGGTRGGVGEDPRHVHRARKAKLLSLGCCSALRCLLSFAKTGCRNARDLWRSSGDKARHILYGPPLQSTEI